MERSALDSVYQELILKHYRSSKFRGELEAPDAVVPMRNPVCGDDILLQVQVRKSLDPARHAGFGRRKPNDVRSEVATLLCVVAQAGHADAAEAQRAYLAGMQRVLPRDHLPYLSRPNGVLALDALHPAPGLVLGPAHAEGQQRPGRGRHERGLVRPVLDQPAGRPVTGPVDEGAVVRAEPGPERQVVAARDDVDAVDLDDADRVDHALDVARRGGPRASGRRCRGSMWRPRAA